MCSGGGGGKPLHLPLHFALNLKLLFLGHYLNFFNIHMINVILLI